MSDFLYNLGTIVDQQFNLSDNKQNTLDTVDGNKVTRYGKLGDFANRFDKTAERRYYDEGFHKHSMNPKSLQVMMQEPDVTVLIKKKEFSSLRVNNKVQFMDKEEKLFLKASSILFRNKCNQIAAYERLCKIERIVKEQGQVDFTILPILLNTYDLASKTPGLKNIFSSNVAPAMEQIRKLIAYNKPAFQTTWTEDPNRLFRSSYGTGTGVIELTTVESVNVTNSIKWGSGSCTINLQDPYRLMTVTQNDIELAIGEAYNPLARSQFVNIEKDLLSQRIESNKQLLNQKRQARRVNNINFVINPDTYLGKRIRVLIDGLGFEINYDSSSNIADNFEGIISGNLKIKFDLAADQGSSVLESQGLSSDEKQLVASIVNAITSLISIDSNIRSQTKTNNKNTNLVRKKMMLHYCNKSIIQPMDVVNIYISSKSEIDNKITGGLQSSFTGFGFLQKASAELNSLTQQFRTAFTPQNPSVDLEKSVFVGKDFPNALWRILRNQFVSDKAGTHVFAGLVSSPGPTTQMSGPGRWSVTVSCKDNSSYFQLGTVNLNPSIENANGPLMDPVTPFKINLDSITGAQREIPELLDENKKFYSSSLPKYMAGPQAGKKVTLNNFQHQDSAPVNPGQNLSTFSQNIFYPPDGTVYRWKEGIGTLTLSKATYGNGYATSIPAQTAPRVSTKDAFAGQDLMNVISLLVVGQPYNFATFYKTVTETDTFSSDLINDPSFFSNLTRDLQQNNQFWGNFQPFKKLVVSESAYAAMINGVVSVQGQNQKLNELLQQRSELYDKLAVTGAGVLQNSNTTIAQLPQTSKDVELMDKLNKEIAQAQASLNQTQNSGLLVVGDDVSFDSSNFLTSEDQKNAMNDPSLRKELRRKINFLTRRMFYKVKSNEDANYFIVDDSYDKDLELQAFSKSLGNNFSLFLNDYDNVYQQIATVAEKLDLEVFADSQGHIQVRPPQYNRVPNSVFYRMLKNKDDNGTQIFPQFLQDLYRNQLQTFFNNIEIVEDQIRLLSAALSIDTDQNIITNLIQAPNFNFLSNESTGHINNIDVVSLFADPENVDLNQLDNFTDSVESQATKVRYAFTPSTQANLLVGRFDIQNTNNSIPVFNSSDPTLISRVDLVSAHLREKTGLQPTTIQKLFSNNGNLNISTASALDVLRITKQISSLISSRQRLIRSAASALQTVRDSLRTTSSLDSFSSKSLTKISFPSLSNGQNIPETLEHMIEDESYDDYGPNSGQRYVIKDHQILSLSFQETAPQFNFVQINGLFAGSDGFFGEGEGPEGLGLGGGGNALTTAYAVDYDLWRMYGFRKGQVIQMNSLSDPETQLAPYAVSVLNRARGEILTASCQIVGNEYQQAGEVVYIESTNMLWYVESVTHNFNYGGSFTTQLTLTHGHNPGEYIPTAFDVVGKILYKNRDYTSNVVVKEESAYNEKPIGALVFSEATKSKDLFSDAFTGKDSSSTTNRNTISNIQYSIVGLINPNNTTTQPKIEIRYYYYSSLALPEDAYLPKYASYVVDLLTNKAAPSEMMAVFGKDIPLPIPKGSDGKDLIEVKAIDLSQDTEYRSPSQKAWEMARALSNENSNSSLGYQKSLVSGVIDIWLNFGES